MLASLGYQSIIDELYEICNNCDDVQWTMDSDDVIVNALDGDEEELWEFKMMFADVSACAYNLLEQLQGVYGIDEYFDDCTVALIGNRYNIVGYDDYEEDYFNLSSYEEHLAETEAGKRLMRMTKKEIIATVGQCMGITMAFMDLRQKYDYLKATMDILRDENASILQTIRDIESAYEKAVTGDWNDTKAFDKLLSALPDTVWIA